MTSIGLASYLNDKMKQIKINFKQNLKKQTKQILILYSQGQYVDANTPAPVETVQ